MELNKLFDIISLYNFNDMESLLDFMKKKYQFLSDEELILFGIKFIMEQKYQI